MTLRAVPPAFARAKRTDRTLRALPPVFARGKRTECRSSLAGWGWGGTQVPTIAGMTVTAALQPDVDPSEIGLEAEDRKSVV